MLSQSLNLSHVWTHPVVYPTTADNYFASKPGKMPTTQPVLEWARPWSHTFFITNLLCWHSHGSSFCCMSLSPSQAYPPRPCQRSPSAGSVIQVMLCPRSYGIVGRNTNVIREAAERYG